MAMAALGLTTRVSAIRAAGIKPLALAAVLFGWLIAGGFAINVLVESLVGVPQQIVERCLGPSLCIDAFDDDRAG